MIEREPEEFEASPLGRALEWYDRNVPPLHRAYFQRLEDGGEPDLILDDHGAPPTREEQLVLTEMELGWATQQALEGRTDRELGAAVDRWLRARTPER